MRRIDPTTGAEVDWSSDPRNPENRVAGSSLPSFTGAEFGVPLPVVYGTYKVPLKIVFLRKGADGVGWIYNPGPPARYDCVNAPIDGFTAAGSSTTVVKVSSIGAGGVTRSAAGWSIYFRTGACAGSRVTIIAIGMFTSTLTVSPALPVAPAAGDAFSVGYAVSSPTGDAVFVLCEAPVTSILRYWRDQNPPCALAYLLAANDTTAEEVVGTSPTTWPSSGTAFGLQSKPESLGMTLAGFVQVRARSLLLTDGKVPDITAEVKGIGASVTVDAHPADVLIDMLAVAHGSSAAILTQSELVTDVGRDGTVASSYRAYCTAMGFMVSRCLDSRSDAANFASELLEQTNSTCIWSEGRLEIVPLGGVAVAGYVPFSTVYAITVDDFAADASSDPVSVRRKADNEVYNAFTVSYQDRASDYSSVPVEYLDAAHASLYGPLRGPDYSGTWITLAAHAQALASIMVQRSISVRSTFTFRLKPKWALLEPADILALTEPVLGLSSFAVRIKSISEGTDGLLDVEAYECPDSTGSPIVIPTQTYDGYASSVDITPLNGSMMAQGAQATATALQSAVEALNDENTLTPSEKPPIVAEVRAITDEYAGIYGATLSGRNAAQQATYAAAYTALVTTYLPTLTTAVLWSSLDANTTIVRTAFDTAFINYYLAKTVLFNANTDLARADAAAAAASAGTALTLANGRNRVWYQVTAPTNPTGGSNLLAGDLWFNTDLNNACPDTACKGHTLDGAGLPNVGSYTHRALYWPHRWNSGAWVDGQGTQQLIASEIVAGTITVDRLQANSITMDRVQLVPNGNIWPNPTSEAVMPTGADAATAEWNMVLDVGASGAFQGTKIRRIGVPLWVPYGFIDVGGAQALKCKISAGEFYQLKCKARTYYTGWTSPATPAAYSSGVTYGISAIVTSAGAVWYSLQAANTNNAPVLFSAWWRRATWFSGVVYAVGDRVVLSGYCYVCQSATSSASPTGAATDNANWRYIRNETLAYLGVEDSAHVNPTIWYSKSASLPPTTTWSDLLVEIAVPAGYDTLIAVLRHQTGSPAPLDSWGDFDNIDLRRTDYRSTKALDGAAITQAGSNRVWYRGNNDADTLGGAPNYQRLSVARRRWNTTAKMFSGQMTLIPSAPSDNLDGMRYAELSLYQQAVAGTGTQGTAPAWQETAMVVLPDRKYQVASADGNAGNIVNSDFTIYAPYVSGGYPALSVVLHNVYGASAMSFWYSQTGAGDYQTMASAGTAFPSTWGGTLPAGTPPAGGGSGGGGCPAPWVPITVGVPSQSSMHFSKPAGEIQVGDYVWTWREVSDGLTQDGGTFNLVTAVSHETNVAVRLTMTDGRKIEVSEQHRLFSNGGWVQAQNLAVGDKVEGDYPGTVESVLHVGTIDVVRITVEGAHTYQTDGLLSHNMKPVDP